MCKMFVHVFVCRDVDRHNFVDIDICIYVYICLCVYKIQLMQIKFMFS